MRASRSIFGALAITLALLASSLALGTASQASPAGLPLAEPQPPTPPRLPPRIEPQVFAQVGTLARTFVASSGSDANPCTLPLPCRTFNRAISQTAAGGEVVALDSAGYGPMTISQSIAIVGAPGAHVAITASTGTAISIAAAAADTIILRNLYLNSQGASFGIVWQSGAVLQIDNVVVSGFSNIGIFHFAPGGVLIATDVVARNNFDGVLLNPPAGALVRATLDHVQLEGNAQVGIFVNAGATGATARLEVSDCVATRNAYGIVAQQFSGGVAEGNVERCQASHNGTGQVTFGGILRISNSVIAFNTLGVAGAGTLSRLNNTLEGNTTNGTFGGTFTAK